MESDFRFPLSVFQLFTFGKLSLPCPKSKQLCPARVRFETFRVMNERSRHRNRRPAGIWQGLSDAVRPFHDLNTGFSPKGGSFSPPENRLRELGQLFADLSEHSATWKNRFVIWGNDSGFCGHAFLMLGNVRFILENGPLGTSRRELSAGFSRKTIIPCCKYNMFLNQHEF